MKDINLQEFCKELHIYEFGIAPWPLPENAKTILYETNPCPFTAADVEERLLGTTEFTPKSAIVCLFPYYVEHNGPSNLSRYTWGTDYHLVINEYLEKLSANDFHGTVRLVQTANDSTEIHLYSSNGTEITNPSGSQKTVMYISVLFAISDFTQEKRDEDYPLFFDAATSSFGDSKESDFYNVIDKIDKQCIIVTKDFITRGKVREEDINKLTCSVYRIKKVDGFDQTNMATIRTIINKIK